MADIVFAAYTLENITTALTSYTRNPSVVVVLLLLYESMCFPHYCMTFPAIALTLINLYASCAQQSERRLYSLLLLSQVTEEDQAKEEKKNTPSYIVTLF